MLIDQNELETLGLGEQATQDLAAQLIMQLNAVASEDENAVFIRHAIAKTLQKAIGIVVDESGAAAVDFCKVNNIGADQNHFVRAGLEFSIEMRADYDYANNATDIMGEPVSYRAAVSEEEFFSNAYKNAKNKLKACKDAIKLAHPRMEAIDPKWTFKYYPQD